MIWIFVALVIGGYFMGNISFARIITKFKNKKDNIDNMGSGNPGSMNMLREQGAILALTTLFFDALKATIPALVGLIVLKNLYTEQVALTGMYVAGLSAVLGHVYPVTYNFQGGKGIACTLGVFSVANPLVSLIAFVVAFVFFLIVKIGSLTSMVYILLFAITQTVIYSVSGLNIWWLIMLIWVIIALDLFAHRKNFYKLFTKTERITSFQEGIKKDVEKLHAKKLKKVNKFEQKADIIENKFVDKIENVESEEKKEKIDNKFNKKIKKVEKKTDKIELKYSKKEHKIIKKGEKVITKIQGDVEIDDAKMKKIAKDLQTVTKNKVFKKKNDKPNSRKPQNDDN